MRRKNMASKGCPVWISYNHVRVDCGLPSIERNVAAHSNNLVLSIDGNFLVHFALGTKVAQCRPVYCADWSKVCARNVILSANSSNPEKASSPW